MPAQSGEGLESSTETVVIKATDAVIFEMTANLKLTQDQIAAARPIIMDNIVKVRKLQQSLKEGQLDSKSMYDQRQALMQEEYGLLGPILTAGQLKAWIIIQQEYDT